MVIKCKIALTLYKQQIILKGDIQLANMFKTPIYFGI